MGQATLDLPDPLQSPPLSPARTDDLLAQMAGQQIERLLSQADGPAPTPAPMPAPAAAAPSTPQAAASEQSAVDSLLEPPPVPTTPQGAANEAAVNSDLNALFTQLSSGSPASTPAAGSEGSPGQPECSAASSPEDSEASAAEALAQEILEDEALTTAARAGLSRASTPPDATRADTHAKIEPATAPALPLRFLNWINSPINSCSDQTRELIGKIAIITTVNALSVLAYVLFFRRH